MSSIVAADRRPVPALQQNCLGGNSGEKEIQEPVQTSKLQGLLPRSRQIGTNPPSMSALAIKRKLRASLA
jgi:hypothetical protein